MWRKIMIFGMTTYTFVHVVISLVGIVSGLVVLLGLVAANRLNGWTVLFLVTTVATCLTGFGFPFVQLLPSHIVGIITLVALTLAIFARYGHRLAGAWRWIYVRARRRRCPLSQRLRPDRAGLHEGAGLEC